VTAAAGRQAQHPAAIEVAALHLARTYGRGDTSPAALRRWAGRIRVWAVRYAGELGDYGREGRSRVYDLAELQRIAQRVSPGGALTPAE
jgi:hypothetical protein